MGFWGMSDEGKKAQNNLNNLAKMNVDQYGNALRISSDAENEANALKSGAIDYWSGRQTEPQASVDQMWSTGKQIMPGADAAIAERANQINQNQKDSWGVTSAYDVNDVAGRNLTEKAGGITNESQAVDNLVKDWAGGAQQRNTGANTGINQNLNNATAFLNAVNTGTYAPLRKATSDTYGALANSSNTAYGKLLGKSDTTYGEQKKTAAGTNAASLADLELYKPAGEANAARIGRSFAPTKANALQRLRTAGVDPNSPQAQSMMANLDATQARAMDDAIAAATDKYISDKRDLGQTNLTNVERIGGNDLSSATGLTLGKETAGQGLVTAGLDKGTTLAEKQGANASDIAKYGTESTNAEAIRNLAEQQGISASEAQQKLANQENTFGRTQDWWDQQTAATKDKRAMEEADYARQKQINDARAAEELTKLGLQSGQFQAGQGYETTSTANKNAAVSNLQQISQNDQNVMLQAQKIAEMFGEDAAKEYLQQYQIEAANAGWGTKLLAGTAASVLSGAAKSDSKPWWMG